ncbi:MAG TPA: lysophospholipid acyltransferase family protein [Solirubrobacteraceae bacterium]|nr:lysophospholipid acyltransferase family protein [Solirubrobacteraceae bacterium]
MPSRPAGARLYRTLVVLGVPLRWWCRLEVRGRELMAPAGTGVLVVSNHDSWLDPLAIGDTLMRAGRPVRFLAKDTLWRSRILARMLDGIRQIPVSRGTGDLAALRAAADALADGEAICIFPEGTLSRGRRLRARRGVARIAQAAPQAQVLLVAVSGGTDLVRFPRRPRVLVELFLPARAPGAGEDHAQLATRLLDEIRERVPPVPAGRRPVDAPAAAEHADAAAGFAQHR